MSLVSIPGLSTVRPGTGGSLDIKFEVVPFYTSNAADDTIVDINLVDNPSMDIAASQFLRPGAIGTVLNTPEANNNFCIGLTDKTNQWAAGFMFDSELNSGGATAGQECVSFQLSTALNRRYHYSPPENVPEEYRLNSLNVGNIKYAVTQYDEVLWDYQYTTLSISIGGSAVTSATVGNQSLGTGVGAVDFPDLANADLVFFALAGHDETHELGQAPINSYDLDARHCFGFYINDGADKQGCLTFHAPNDDPSGTPGKMCVGLYNDTAIAKITHGATENYEAPVSNVDGTGADLTTSANAGNNIVGYQAFNFSTAPDMDVVSFDIPATGNLTVSGLSFLGFGGGH